MNLSPVMQKRLETRGITCTNDAEFAKLAPWFRFTPLLGTTLTSPTILKRLRKLMSSS